MFEKEVEEILIIIIMVIKDSLSMFFSVMILCVICFVMKKFIVEEKEVLFIVEIKFMVIKSRYGYEFGGLFGVLCMMIVFVGCFCCGCVDVYLFIYSNIFN